MTKETIHNKLHFYLALVIAFTLPFVKITPIFIILIAINWLLEGNLRSKLHFLLKSKPGVLFICFYLIHVTSMLYTENINSGLFDLQVKLSLLIFPLLLASKPFSNQNKIFILIAFIVGIIAISLTMLINATYQYITTGKNMFFYQEFALFVHTSYISMYINVAIALLAINLLQSKKYFQNISTVVSLILICLFALIVILLSSKSGLITLILMLLYFLFHSTFILKKYWIGLTSTIITIAFIIAINTTQHRILERFKQFTEAIVSYKHEDVDTVESTKIRLRVWESAVVIIKKHLLIGVGSGDVKDELMNDYKRRNLLYIYSCNLNAHNEFLQVFVGLGIIGFLILMATLFIPLIQAWEIRNYAYTAFLIIIIINFCFESMLETQAGTMFYGFFNSMLCFTKNKNLI